MKKLLFIVVALIAFSVSNTFAYTISLESRNEGTKFKRGSFTPLTQNTYIAERIINQPTGAAAGGWLMVGGVYIYPMTGGTRWNKLWIPCTIGVTLSYSIGLYAECHPNSMCYISIDYY